MVKKFVFWDDSLKEIGVALRAPITLTKGGFDVLVSKQSGNPYIVYHGSQTLYVGDAFHISLSGSGNYWDGFAVGSPFGDVNLSTRVLRRHSGGVTNESNIYDDNFNSYAQPGTWLSAGETREVIVWDLGSVATRWLFAKVGGDALRYSRIKTSTDDVTYTTFVETTYTIYTAQKWGTANFRYVKWEVYNATGSSTEPAFYLYCCAILSPKGTLPVYDVLTVSSKTTGMLSVLYDASSTIDYYVLRKWV